MKITIHIDENMTDTEITVSCGKLTAEVENLLSAIRMQDRKTFVYTKEDCFESRMKLYEMEEQLCQAGFIRASRVSLVHLKYVKSLRAEINRKVRVTLENGEQIIVSRQYAEELKRKLGVIVGFILVFDWFPAGELLPWIMFLLCFAVSFVISVAVSSAYEKLESGKMEEALKKYKEENKEDCNGTGGSGKKDYKEI